MADTFQIEDKTLLSDLLGTEQYLVQRADGSYRRVLGSSIATQGFVNTVFVSSEADFPLAVAGVITLLNDTTYILLASVVTANRFVLPKRTGLSALDFGVATLTYTGTDTFITGTTIDSFYIHEIAIFASNPASTLFDLTGVPESFPAFCIMETISYIGFGNLGVIKNCSFRLGNTGFINFGQGLSVTGSIVYQQTGSLYVNSVAATTPFISFSGTHGLIQVKDGNINTLATEEFIFIDPAITLTEAVIAGNVYRNGSSSWFGVGSLDEEDVRFEYSDNGDGPSSAEAANICISVPAAETVVAGSFEKVAGTYNAGILKRFTHAAGTLTYIGQRTRVFQVTISASITTSNNNRNIQLSLAKNGTTVTESIQERKMGTGADIGCLTVVYEIELSTGDTVESQYTTVTTATDITAKFLNFIIS